MNSLLYVENAHSVAEKKFTGLEALTPGSTRVPAALTDQLTDRSSCSARILPFAHNAKQGLLQRPLRRVLEVRRPDRVTSYVPNSVRQIEFKANILYRYRDGTWCV